MMQVDRLCIQYGAMTAVHSINFFIKRGQSLALLGVNGAGKSTTLSCLAGILPAAEGRILYLEKDITSMDVRGRVKLGIVLVPEGRRVFPMMTVKDNLLMGSYTRPGKGVQQLDKLVSRFPVLKDKFLLPAMNLSGGEQQQLSIARAMMSKPALLLLDEPTMGLSPKMAEQVFEYLEELRQAGMTMIISSQDTRRLADFCDQTLYLKNGTAHKLT